MSQRAENITNDLAGVNWRLASVFADLVDWLCKAVCQPITKRLATIFWLLSGVASRFISQMASSSFRRQKAGVLSRPRRAFFRNVPRSGKQPSAVVLLFSGLIKRLMELLAIPLGNPKMAAKSLVICLLPSVFCYAEELPDPTRPPAIITIPATTVGSAPSGLQSIIISKTRRAAIIDGETVELKGKHGDATLIEVTETGVVLQGAQGRQMLTLFPNVKIMQKEIQATPKLSVKEGGLAQKTKLKARKEHK